MNPSALADCRSQQAPGDVVVLLDRGLELLADAASLEGLDPLVSGVDRRARGLPLPSGCEDVEDAGVVDLVTRHTRVLSWT